MLNPDWRTSNVVALAARLRDTRDLSSLPIIADALQDAGCYEPLLESLRAGAPTAEAAGYLVPDGWWEYARLGDEAATLLKDGERVCHLNSDCNIGKCGYCRVRAIRSRRTELWNLHTVACPTCGDAEWVRLGVTARPCPTCPTRVRWDRAKCPECERFRIAPGTTPCEVCGGSGDLLSSRNFMEERIGLRERGLASPRSLSFDGQLPLVTARVEEIAEEVRCEACRGEGSLTRFRGPGTTNAYRDDCDSCSGTGRIVRPTAWLRSLPVWYEVDVEGVEPHPNGAGQTWYNSDRGEPRSQLVPLESELPEWKAYTSPAAARQALIAAVRKWRFT